MALEFPQEFDDLIAQNKAFELLKLSEVVIGDVFNEELNENLRSVIVPELGDLMSRLSIDEIDELILQELHKPILYDELIVNMTAYLEEDVDEQGRKDFIELIQNRIRFFIVEKVLFLKIMVEETDLIPSK